nr:MAG TPA: hypothetical protein [Caudoviricetes sp.]
MRVLSSLPLEFLILSSNYGNRKSYLTLLYSDIMEISSVDI